MRVALGDSRPAVVVGSDAVGVVGHWIGTAQQEDAERAAVVGIAGRRSDVHLDGAGGAGLSVDDPSYRTCRAAGLPDRYGWRCFRQPRIASPGQTDEIARRGDRAQCLDKT
ncbi:hypothetical protein [Cutibacterium acnes]|uniref:hypothetical protein n=1 Tax=Cutibacterium acnes TaxID=1747 RepID=UPI000203F5C4|nr:hypothetical protein [Cutibacterium acnes]EGE74125.1 hypothetical protein HMPREF9344_01663 [Cutibacterium acnes HL097PA1]EIA12643.1 hypothetical protein TICEST70_00170 [Cutibacterium acnes PRP-38]REB12151.1 hypothetical protein COH13_08015 [Cutibacterium acnes]REB15580.1 hypothetical protein COH12_10735 [Cutibacterium acnes]TLG13798.1 hypothetical protein FD522_05870 [Cutibacterium acnes]